ncbi:phosphotyrosine protein phosphatase [Burkholderia territorii]|uniref:low molecular weight protein-tyrosine-phosphatase n=1 Tax=Burkholderia territorii TaxID=1503055 RepID=UPI0007553C3D|nr:low molecular weight protein-tyrosine-phosphatase [Burkholderia territorii]KVL52168.1 phosphotyrosine protein phosphatase [Burkholderia territorii]KVN41095.1 phosphotyrosine protein phosphatase [Burkholderia territorii]
MTRVAICFVCLGNICRSPTAEGVMRHQVDAAGLADRIAIDSAGTGDWHVGEPPDTRAQAAARTRGYDLSALRARQVSAADFERFDLLLAMDEANFAELRRRCPPGHRDKVRLLMEFAPGATETEVADPYFGGAQGFETVLDQVERACAGLLETLRSDVAR